MNPLASLLSRLSQGEARQDYASLLPQVELGTTIPKQIWRIFLTQKPGTPLPEIAKETEAKLRSLNPDYALTIVDNAWAEQFIRQQYGEVVWSYYQRIDASYGAARADFLRYLILYRLGGVYVDLKVSYTKPFSEHIFPGDRLLLSYWDNLPGESHEGWGHVEGLEAFERGEYIMSSIHVAAGHPLLRAVILRVMRNIDTYDPHLHNTGCSGTLWLTGPVAYTLVIEELKERGELNEARGDFREVNFVEDLGMVYPLMKLSGLSDYRSNVAPLVATSSWVDSLNRGYFQALAWYRHRILKQGK